MVCSLFIVCIVSVMLGVLHADNTTSRFSMEDAYEICQEDAMCRNLYGLGHGEASLASFRMTLGGRNGLQWASAIAGDPERALAAVMALKQAVLSETRCGPNKYIQWLSDRGEAQCACYTDKDCSANNVPLCYSNTHPVLLAGFLLVAILVGAAIIQINARSEPIAPKES